MVPKSRSKGVEKAAQVPILSLSPAKAVGLAAAFMSLAALTSPVSQANLSPVYGSIPASIYHQRGMAITAFLAIVTTRSSLNKFIPTNVHIYIPVLAYYIPVIQWALFPYSTVLGAKYGPLVTESLTFYPLLLLATIATSKTLDRVDLSRFPKALSDGVRPAAPFIFFSVIEKAFNDYLPVVIGKADFLTRSGLELLIATAYAAIGKSPYLLLSSPAMLHTLFSNPHHQSVYTTKLLNKTLDGYNYTLLERRDSLTGYISVLEDHNNEFRVLRCDHSLLGGDWLITEKRKAQGQTVRESIYSVFTMLEAVRLVESAERKDSESHALFIGLGIGTSPAAFIKHGINTTIVEIDPVVHEFAIKYFDLPTDHTAVLENAVGFVNTASVEHPKTYDYIIHDVFTGGAEPTALFTLEFLQGLEKLLKDDGVVAINYAGDVRFSPPRIVLATIHSVFPTCRIFRDAPEDPEDPHNTFINMVVFCTKSIDRPLTFRKGTPADWMDSLSRKSFIPPNDNLEIQLPQIFGENKWKETEILKQGNEQIIEKHHQKSALWHWTIMRTVLPDVIWENW